MWRVAVRGLWGGLATPTGTYRLHGPGARLPGVDAGHRLVDQTLGFGEMNMVARRLEEEVTRFDAVLGGDPLLVLGEGRQGVGGVAAGQARKLAAREHLVAGRPDFRCEIPGHDDRCAPALRVPRLGPDGADRHLTLRERQVLRHLAYGLSNDEIGAALGIGLETVKTHVHKLLRKMSMRDRTQAAVWAVKNGVV